MHSKYDEIQEILDDYKQELPEVEPEWPYKVQSAYVFIYEHLFDPRLTVGWMKQKHRINGKSFAAQFHKSVGTYPKSYILHHRIAASKHLLQQTGASITQIALAVGFRSLSAFCNTFKSKEGIQPTKWQRSKQN
jgi:AraC-like DNA-binding protein